MTQWVVIIGYVLATLGLGYLGLRMTKDDQDFYIAGGRLGWAVGGASIAATQMSSGLFIGTIGIMYAVGWSFGWVVFVFPVAYWLMVAVIAPRFTRQRRISLPDFVEARFHSRAARVIAAAIILIAFVVYIGTWTGWIVTDGGYYRHWAESTHMQWTGALGWVPLWLQNLWHYQTEMYNYSINLHVPHPYQSNPLTWLFMIRPTSMYYVGTTQGQGGCDVSSCSAAITWWMPWLRASPVTFS